MSKSSVIILSGNPLSTGNIYATGFHGGFAKRYMKPQGRTMKESYQWQAKSQWKSKVTDKDISISVHLYFGDKRKRDIDNYHKLSLDALTGIVWEDDSQIQEMHIKKGYDKENPRIEIEVL